MGFTMLSSLLRRLWERRFEVRKVIFCYSKLNERFEVRKELPTTKKPLLQKIFVNSPSLVSCSPFPCLFIYFEREIWSFPFVSFFFSRKKTPFFIKVLPILDHMGGP